MDLKIVKQYELGNYDTVVIPLMEGRKLELGEDKALKEAIDGILSKGLFKSSSKEVYSFTFLQKEEYRNIVLLGLGKEEKIDSQTMFLGFAKGFAKCKELKSKDVLVHLEGLGKETKTHENLEKIFESGFLIDYTFEKYKAKKKLNPIENLDYFIKDSSEDALKEAKSIAGGIVVARDLINEPALNMTPYILSEEAKKLGEENGFKVEVYDEEKIADLEMDAFLAVGKGSANKPKLIVMEYSGNPHDAKKVGLVGKGLTFDSGGYSIKSAEGMSTMACDMGGAAAVIGAMTTISKMKLNINVVSVIATCENRISDKAYLPGDVIKSMSGKYIEVLNTDAEGRITLADALTYIREKHNVESIIDIATLTGAVQVALGDKRAGIYTNDDGLRQAVNQASKISGEKVWELPLDEDLKHVIESHIADIKNSAQGSNAGGYATVAALFLQEFVDETPWLHMDIGGTVLTSKDLDYCPKGALGFGTSLLYNAVKILSDSEEV